MISGLLGVSEKIRAGNNDKRERNGRGEEREEGQVPRSKYLFRNVK